jgi:hypothetical protein
MRLKTILTFLLLTAFSSGAGAESCPVFIFPGADVCSSADCSVTFSAQPSGVARVLRDNAYGTQLGINFGVRSILRLGDNGRINFGSTGGTQAIRTNEEGDLDCTAFTPGPRLYTVDMAGGGWLQFTTNNWFDLNTNGLLALAAGSKIDGRLDIKSQGTVGVSAIGDMVMPNADISAKEGITLHGTGDIQIGDLQNEGDPADPASNVGINISARGDIKIGSVDSTGDFNVMADGDITIGEIGTAESISLMIRPPTTGIITIDGRQSTDGSVMCSPPDDCNGFALDGAGGEEDCEPLNPDGSVSDCAGGGGGPAGPDYALVLVLACYRKYWLSSRDRNRPGIRYQCSPQPDGSV